MVRLYNKGRQAGFHSLEILNCYTIEIIVIIESL